MSYEYNSQNRQDSQNQQTGQGTSWQGGRSPYRGADYYRYPYSSPGSVRPGGAAHSQPQPQPPIQPKQEKKGRKAGRVAAYLASLLAVGLISGAAGGGATYYLMSNSPAVTQQAPAQPDASSSAQPAPQSQATQPAEPEAPAASEAPAAQEAPQQQGGLGVAGVVEKASGSVVEIGVEITSVNPFYGGEVTTPASGSGVIISSDGYIITNNHVIDGASAITVRTKDGSEYDGVLVGTDVQTDLAVVKVEAEGLPPATFADSDAVQVGETAIAIGNPLGTLGGTVTSGIISAKGREVTIDNQTMTLLQTSAAVNPGNSGGGLFNDRGELVGIVNAKTGGSNVEGLGFAIPSNQAKEVSGAIIEHGYVTGRPEFGISVLAISDPQTAFINRVNEYGVYVSNVTKDNGLKVGDLIVSVDGAEIETAQDVKDTLKGRSVGDTLLFSIKRDGRAMEVPVTLTEKIPDYILERQAGSDV